VKQKILIGLFAAVMLGVISPALYPETAANQRPQLIRPYYTWLPCECHGDQGVGVNHEDFIVLNQYIQGLEHEYRACRGEMM